MYDQDNIIDFHKALEMADQSRTVKKSIRCPCLRIHLQFYDAMTCLCCCSNLAEAAESVVIHCSLTVENDSELCHAQPVKEEIYLVDSAFLAGLELEWFFHFYLYLPPTLQTW
jgi:hypothetical protein